MMCRVAGPMLILLAAVGCADGDAPPRLAPGDLGADQAASAGCTTACDCPAGQACNNGNCEARQEMVFCCGTAACMGGALCQASDGTISQCDRPDGGITPVTDGGGPASACEMTQCSQGVGGNTFCKLACGTTSATCIASGGIAHCMP